MKKTFSSCLPFFLLPNFRLLFVHGFAVSARPTHPPLTRCARQCPMCGHAAPLRSQASRGSMAYCVRPLKKDAKRPQQCSGRASSATAILLVGKRHPKVRPRRTRLFPPALGEPLADHLHGLKPTAPLPSHATGRKVDGKMILRVAATGFRLLLTTPRNILPSTVLPLNPPRPLCLWQEAV